MRIRLRKAFVQRFGFASIIRAVADVNPFLLQAIQAAPRHLRVGSCMAATTRETPAAISAVAARRRSAVMTAGFQRHIGVAPGLFASHAQRMHFRSPAR